ncbi:MAG: preprotein translocase subunit YajC [Clostridia bacterium]|nr:preprotein translocase subunit YajC [Clostridia bacterium]MBO5913088.1 preprotein translocase subunit YajC [Clostridia bacterium]
MQYASMILMLVIFGGMIFFMNRSQKKKQKKEQEERDSVQVGDEIVTIGGFVVKVISVKDDHYIVESPQDHSKMKLMKWALSSNNTVHDTTAK